MREKCLDQADALTCERAIETGRNYESKLGSLKKPASDEDPTVNTLNQENVRNGIFGSVQKKKSKGNDRRNERCRIEAQKNDKQMRTVWL